MIRFVAILILAPMLARAHIGSPNVFFEGPARPYHVRVVIRPPAVLPGVAKVDVRSEGATNISVQPMLWEAGASAPAPVIASPVPGANNLFHAQVWLLRSGAYNVQVRVAGPPGMGTAVVPLNSASFRPPRMPPVIGLVLFALGLILFAGAICLAGLTARDSVRRPGLPLPARDNIRGWAVAGCAAVVFSAALYAGKVRWQKMDRAFRNDALDQALPVSASVQTNGTLRLLRITPAANGSNPAWDTLLADHGKLMHLFLLGQPEFDAFAHLHPVRRSASAFENVLPPLPHGEYALYAEITHENGLSRTLIGKVTLPASMGSAPQRPLTSNMLNEVLCQSSIVLTNPVSKPFALDADDSWHVNPAPQARATSTTSPLMGGLTMVMQNSAELLENVEASLRFAVFAADGRPAPLQHYMGMRGHAVIRRTNGDVFTHLHPVGTISMAAQNLFRQLDNGETAKPDRPSSPGETSIPAHEVSFPYAFPQKGEYRLWVQVRTNERVVTGVFGVHVR